MTFSQPTLTRASLIRALTQKIGLPPQTAAVFLEATLETMILALIQRENVKISGFGSFNVHHKNKRIGRNPKTKKEALIKPRHVVSFTASALLKTKIQKEGLKEL